MATIDLIVLGMLKMGKNQHTIHLQKGHSVRRKRSAPECPCAGEQYAGKGGLLADGQR